MGFGSFFFLENVIGPAFFKADVYCTSLCTIICTRETRSTCIVQVVLSSAGQVGRSRGLSRMDSSARTRGNMNVIVAQKRYLAYLARTSQKPGSMYCPLKRCDDVPRVFDEKRWEKDENSKKKSVKVERRGHALIYPSSPQKLSVTFDKLPPSHTSIPSQTYHA